NFNTHRIEPVVAGGPYDSANSPNACSTNGISNPDNLFVLKDGRLIIGEDTSKHENNMAWIWQDSYVGLVESEAGGMFSDADVVGPLVAVSAYDSGLGEGASEVPAFHEGTSRLYVTNALTNSIDIIDVSSPEHPSLFRRVVVTGGAPSSVDVSDDGSVAVAVIPDVWTDNGAVVFLDANGDHVGTVDVGPNPDHVIFTADGSQVLVANEGQPSDDYTIDPEGSISVIDTTSMTSTLLGLSGFNGQDDGSYYLGPSGTTMAQGLEPEYIAIADDGLSAMVTLQESNALARLVNTAGTWSIDSIHSLGLWTADELNFDCEAMDLSDKDDTPDNLCGVELYFRPQPDTIKTFTIGEQVFWVTANEGDSRDYDGWSEEVRAEDLTLDDAVLGTSEFTSTADLMDRNVLGRLKTTTICGDEDGDGDMDFICAYGSRNAIVWYVDELGELQMASTLDIDADPFLHEELREANAYTASRDDDKGSEPEGVIVGTVDEDCAIIFVGLERAGGVMTFEFCDQEGDYQSWPYGWSYVASQESPESLVVAHIDGEDYLVVANEVSGTVTMYAWNDGPWW
ncbi:MAG: choice-of-anchor I family protein, partial [archaeon]|nr:choice-of-anchor I family protein [archaeon]